MGLGMHLCHELAFGSPQTAIIDQESKHPVSEGNGVQAALSGEADDVFTGHSAFDPLAFF